MALIVLEISSKPQVKMMMKVKANVVGQRNARPMAVMVMVMGMVMVMFTHASSLINFRA